MRWHTLVPFTSVAVLVVSLSACGEPILRNAPKPDPGAVAGIAAAAAAAATLADPAGAAQRQEQKPGTVQDNRGVVVKDTVPADVLDRLDEHPGSAAGSETDRAAAPSAPMTPSPGSPVTAGSGDPATSATAAKPGKPRPGKSPAAPAPSTVAPVTLWPINPSLPDPTTTP